MRFMLSAKLYRFVSKIALFAVIFAALAPSVSHALAAQRGVNFAQEICASNGRKLQIEVLTTKGQQITAEFNVAKQENSPKGITHHLEHCPFCANPSADAAIEAPHAQMLALLAAAAQQRVQTQQPIVGVFSSLPPPALAPPTLL